MVDSCLLMHLSEIVEAKIIKISDFFKDLNKEQEWKCDQVLILL